MDSRYLLVTPCRNEVEHLPSILASIVAQTVMPSKWVIVDDGSSDGTTEFLEAAAKEHDFIEVYRKPDRGRRAVGPGVIEALEFGLAQVCLDDYDFFCKLDADLELPPQYFERIMDAFAENPWLGTYSGKLYLRIGDRLVHERLGDENSCGPAKFYRVACYRDIGGFVQQVSWDGIDGHLCRMNGWLAASRDDPEIRIIHRRRMGSSQESFWVGRLRWGRGKYFMGSSLLYVFCVAVYRSFERPYLVSGWGILWGYLKAWGRGASRYENPEYRRFLRRFERRCLFLGKGRTLRRYKKQTMEAFPDRGRAEGGRADAAARPPGRALA